MRKFGFLIAAACAIFAQGVFGANPLPTGWDDIVGNVVEIEGTKSSNTKQQIVATWMTSDSHVWVMFLASNKELGRNVEVYVSGNASDVDKGNAWSPTGASYVTLNYENDYHPAADFSGSESSKKFIRYDGTVLTLPNDGKGFYFYPMDVTKATGLEFGHTFVYYLDCVELGGGHDVGGLATPVIPDGYGLLTVLCTYGDVKTVAEIVRFPVVAHGPVDVNPQGKDKPEGDWALYQATTNDVVTTVAKPDTVTYTPVSGEEMTVHYYYVIPTVTSLWITDHADAGPGKVHLAFEPTFAGNLKATETLVQSLGAKDCFRFKSAQTEAALTGAMPVSAPLRAGTGTQDIAKGWVWVTVDMPQNDVGVDGWTWKVLVKQPETTTPSEPVTQR